ncbi:MAG: hypothetical protein MI867_12470 [Pseudomonadales bacterium]|nr:hypothetical protein [Pseudomonadales bacterium]
MLDTILSLLSKMTGFFSKLLPYIFAAKWGGDRVKNKQDKKDAEILEEQNDVDPIRSHDDVRKRVRERSNNK